MASAFAAMVTYRIQFILLQAIIPSTRPVSLGLLCVEGIIFSGLYIAIILRTSYLDAYDRMLFKRHLVKLGMRHIIDERVLLCSV